MSMQDPISDMLTRLRNAQQVGKEKVTMPSSKQKCALAQLLKDEGYIKDFNVAEGAKPELEVNLKYHHGKPVIASIKRVSRPSLRVYKAAKDLPQVLGGLGIAVISTSQGIMSDRAARAAGVGGEVLCFVE